MKNIAVLTGGYSGEIEVSMKSASTVMKYLEKGIYNPILVTITKDRWSCNCQDEIIDIDKNDFSFIYNNEKISFDFAFIVIHGSPGENGILQGYFESVGISYSTGDVLNSAMTFNKIATKQALDNLGCKSADYIHFRDGASYDVDAIIELLGLPIFVKPAEEGSSLGITKVSENKDLKKAIEYAFSFHDEVLLEGFMDGREITCGVLEMNGEVIALPITEVITEKDFFDYAAKYEHDQTTEVTPADLDSQVYSDCQELTIQIYNKLGCEGIVRIDYILTSDSLNVIEVNTVPGLTDMSFIPQQARAAGIDLTSLFEAVINI